MAFEATKKEWCELYTFFRLLADGKVVLGTAEAKIGEMSWPIAVIQREEHDGTRRYYIEEESVRIEGETGVKSMPREDFGIVADLILQAVNPPRKMMSPRRREWKNFWTKPVSSIWKQKQKIVQISRLPFGIRKLR